MVRKYVWLEVFKGQYKFSVPKARKEVGDVGICVEGDVNEGAIKTPRRIINYFDFQKYTPPTHVHSNFYSLFNKNHNGSRFQSISHAISLYCKLYAKTS